MSPALKVGETVTYTRTLGESDAYLFAGITGDSHRNHLDEEYMRGTPYGGRIVQGGLLAGLVGACSTRLLDRAERAAVAYGFDRIRFVKGVRFGDTVTVRYEVAQLDADSGKVRADVTIVNQRDETVAVATHLLKLL
ncbi:MAG: MaoC family dehydratase [Conexibacter sp.]